MAPIHYSESIGYNAEFLRICSCTLLNAWPEKNSANFHFWINYSFTTHYSALCGDPGKCEISFCVHMVNHPCLAGQTPSPVQL